MLTTKEQEQILKLAEDLARSRVMAFQRAEMRGDNAALNGAEGVRVEGTVMQHIGD